MNDNINTNNSSEIKSQLRVNRTEDFSAYTDAFYILNATANNAIEKMLIDDYQYYRNLHNEKLKLLFDMSYNDSYDNDNEEAQKQKEDLLKQIDICFEKQKNLERYLKPIVDREKIKFQQEHKLKAKLSKIKKWLHRNLIAIIVCIVMVACTATFIVYDNIKTKSYFSQESTENPQPTIAPIKIVKEAGTVRAGKTATIKIKGAANTQYTIIVKYNYGYSKASGLHSKNSDKNGEVSWSWKVGNNITPGTYDITITGGNNTLATQFTVK